MQSRIFQMGAAIAAVVLILMVARTAAFAGDSESCSETDMNVGPLVSSDGTSVECYAATGPPNKATAHASQQGVAVSDAEDGSKAVSSASGTGAMGSAFSLAESGSSTKATASGEDSEAMAAAEDDSNATASASRTGAMGGATSIAEGGASTKATASGEDSDAVALIQVSGGGKATSTATDGAMATAEIEWSRGR